MAAPVFHLARRKKCSLGKKPSAAHVPRGTLAAEVNEEDRDVRRRDAGNTRGWRNRTGTIAVELDPTLHRQRRYLEKIKIIGDG